MATLISVNVGLPCDVEWNGRTIRTAIWKTPVDGRVLARRLNIEGDAQADLEGHGGEQRAVMVYQLSSYRHWSNHFGGRRFDPGNFGENLTVEGLEDDDVCIGDRYRIGGAVFEVSQPRVTCFKVGVRINCAEMPALLVSHGRPGFYMRVIEEGEIGAGDAIVKILDGPETMSVVQVDELLYRSAHPTVSLQRVLGIGALSPGWRGSFEALLAAGARGATNGNAGLVAGGGGSLAWTGYRALQVVATREECCGVRSFVFAAPDGSVLPAFLPGQHIAIRLKIADSSEAVTRLYSLSGPPGTATYRISVKREPEGRASRYLHSSVQVGSMIEVSAPRGDFELSQGAGPVVLISAGVGATPLISMLHALVDDPIERKREVWWIHSARDGEHHVFRSEVSNLIQGLPAARSYITYSRPTASDSAGDGFDGIGHLGINDLKALGLPTDADFYLCGPGEFMTDLDRVLRERGVAPGRLHAETFGAPSHGTPNQAAPSAPHQPPGPRGSGPSVNFARSGLAVPFSDRFRSVLELAEACNVPVHWSCRTGVCQTCQTPLIDGAISYRPEPLASPAAGTILLCCARPVADIELDL